MKTFVIKTKGGRSRPFCRCLLAGWFCRCLLAGWADAVLPPPPSTMPSAMPPSPAGTPAPSGATPARSGPPAAPDPTEAVPVRAADVPHLVDGVRLVDRGGEAGRRRQGHGFGPVRHHRACRAERGSRRECKQRLSHRCSSLPQIERRARTETASGALSDLNQPEHGPLVPAANVSAACCKRLFDEQIFTSRTAKASDAMGFCDGASPAAVSRPQERAGVAGLSCNPEWPARVSVRRDPQIGFAPLRDPAADPLQKAALASRGGGRRGTQF